MATQRLDLEEGKRLLSEATAGPWTRHEHWEGLDPTRKARNVYIDAPTARSDHVAFCGCVDRENPSAYVDATLIVWLRNNADSLIAAAEEAEKLRAVVKAALSALDERAAGRGGELHVAAAALILRDALAALTPPEPLPAQQETP